MQQKGLNDFRVTLPHVFRTAQPDQWAYEYTHYNGPITKGKFKIPLGYAIPNQLQILGSHDNVRNGSSENAQIQEYGNKKSTVPSIG